MPIHASSPPRDPAPTPSLASAAGPLVAPSAPLHVGLVLGCARSGTSILGELIAAHERVRYLYEAHEIWELGGSGPDGSHRLDAAAATPEVVARVRARFAEEAARGDAERAAAGADVAAEPTVVVEKCPRNALRVPYLRVLLPEARLIHIVRDGRDVACSLRPGIGGKEWNHLKPPDWRRLAGLPWHERCARVWGETVELAERELEGTGRLLVRYEDLLRDPAREAARVLEHLGLPPSPRVDAFLPRISDRLEGGYVAGGGSLAWHRLDHERRVGRRRENLSDSERREVERILAPTLARFGYEPDSDATG